MTQISTLTLGFIFLTQILFAQDQKNFDQKPYIEVTGHAEKKIVPDEIYLSITIKERESGKDKISVEQQDIDLKKALQELNISLENLTVADAQADYIRVKWSKKDVISQSEYELKLMTAKQVAEVFQKLDDLKIDNAFISKVSHSKIKELRKEVEIEAIKAAKIKADYLLEAIGQKTGPALIINERGADTGGHYRDVILLKETASISAYEGMTQGKTIGTIEFRKIKLETTMYVKFQVE
jgi:uncharacterized protein